MEGRTKVIPHIFFNGITLFKKFTQITCKSFTKLRLICYKVCSIVITYFRPSPQTLCDGVVKLLAEASELIITLRISSTLSSAQPLPRSASFSGPNRWKSEGAKSGTWGEDEGANSTPLLQFPSLCTDCCTVWRCHESGGLDSSSCWPNASNSRKTLTVALTTEFSILKC